MTILRSLAFNVFFYVWLAMMMLVMFPFLFTERSYMQRVIRAWSGGVQRGVKVIVGIDYELRGRENIPDGSVIFACKHQSTWETMVFLVIFKNIVYVMKQELMLIPLWGLYARKYGSTIVDRRAGAGALKRMLREIRAFLGEGRSVILFPEGTRMAPGERRPFLPGVAAIYAGTSVPVIPVALNSGVFWGRRSFIKYPGTITVEFLPAMPADLDRRAFLALMEERIDEAALRLRAEALNRGAGKQAPTI